MGWPATQLLLQQWASVTNNRKKLWVSTHTPQDERCELNISVLSSSSGTCALRRNKRRGERFLN